MNNLICLGNCEYPEGLIEERALCKCVCHSQPKEIPPPETKMTDCNGILGKLMGHKFERFLISKKLSPSCKFESFEMPLYALERILDGFQEYDYKIRCKRCGITAQNKDK
jgi:hypothetical protein